MGQLGKLGDKTFPARILEYVGLRSKMYSILTVQPDGARKEKRKIKGVPKKAVTNVRHLEYREVLEEGSKRRAAFAQLRSRARDRRGDRREKSLLPFNDKVYGLAAAAVGRLRSARLHALRPRDGVPRGAPASRARSDTAAAAEPMLGVDCRNQTKRSRALAAAQDDFLNNLPTRAGMASAWRSRQRGRSQPYGRSDGTAASHHAGLRGCAARGRASAPGQRRLVEHLEEELVCETMRCEERERDNRNLCWLQDRHIEIIEEERERAVQAEARVDELEEDVASEIIRREDPQGRERRSSRASGAGGGAR